MTFFIYMGFMVLMLFGLALGIVILMVWSLSRDGEPKKKTAVLLLKGLGVFVPVYLGLFYFAHQTLINYFEVTCGPNPEDVAVMKPQAEVISNYILQNGPPKSMEEIPNLISKWVKCERTSKNVERCFFHNNGSEYETTLDFMSGNYSSYIYLKTYNKKSESGATITLRNDSNNAWTVQSIIKPYSTKDDGICNPMRM